MMTQIEPRFVATVPTRVAIAVVESHGAFLVGQRPPGVPLAGMWEFPGGKIHSGESPEAAAVRECLEETGLAVCAIRQYPTVVHDYPHGRVELFFVGCELLGAESTEPADPFIWVERAKLGDLGFPPANVALIRRLLSSSELAG